MSDPSKPVTGPDTSSTPPWRHRRLAVVILAIVTLLLMATLFFQGALNVLPYVRSDRPSGILWLYTLSAFNFISLVVFLFILGRNVLKLMRERATNQVGARFRTRLLLFSVTISLLPLIFLFLLSYGLINRAVDKWFSSPADQSVRDAVALMDELKDGEQERLHGAADKLAERVAREVDPSFGSEKWIKTQVDRMGNPR